MLHWFTRLDDTCASLIRFVDVMIFFGQILLSGTLYALSILMLDWFDYHVWSNFVRFMDLTWPCSAEFVHCGWVAVASSPLSCDVLRGRQDRVEIAFCHIGLKCLICFLSWSCETRIFSSSHRVCPRLPFSICTHLCGRIRHLCAVSCKFFTFMSVWCQSKSHEHHVTVITWLGFKVHGQSRISITLCSSTLVSLEMPQSVKHKSKSSALPGPKTLCADFVIRPISFLVIL